MTELSVCSYIGRDTSSLSKSVLRWNSQAAESFRWICEFRRFKLVFERVVEPIEVTDDSAYTHHALATFATNAAVSLGIEMNGECEALRCSTIWKAPFPACATMPSCVTSGLSA